MAHAGTLRTELVDEMARLRAVLERVPDARLDDRPHARSRSLGELAGHLARIPGWIDAFLEQDSYDVAKVGTPAEPPASRGEILALFDAACARAEAAIVACSDARLAEPWHLVRGETVVEVHTRRGAVRRFLIEHAIHHRGQLTVHLRMLDIAVPALYGASADEPG